MYFPGPVFAWVFLGVLAALTAVMAVIDSRTATIPKKWTIGTLLAGVVAQMIRCATLAYLGTTPIFKTDNILLGAVEGFGYAAIAAAVGFGMMFVLWLLGACGGGDVKLVAAVGAWVGLFLIGQVILVSIPVLFAVIAFRVLTGQVKMTEMRKMKRPGSPLKTHDKAAPVMKAGSRLRTTYSLPIFVATMLVMLFTFRGELELAAPATPTPPSEVPSNVQN